VLAEQVRRPRAPCDAPRWRWWPPRVPAEQLPAARSFPAPPSSCSHRPDSTHENPHGLRVGGALVRDAPPSGFMSGGSPNNASGLSSFDWSTGAGVSQMRAIRIDRRLRAGHPLPMHWTAGETLADPRRGPVGSSLKSWSLHCSNPNRRRSAAGASVGRSGSTGGAFCALVPVPDPVPPPLARSRPGSARPPAGGRSAACRESTSLTS